jgi:hypothetical protein
MFLFQRYQIRSYEMGLHFHQGEFRGLLGAGTHWFFDPLGRVAVQVVSQRSPQLVHDQLDLIVKSGVLKGHAAVVDLKDDQRGLVWVDGRFQCVLPPGLYAYWTGRPDVHIEVVDARRPRFEHEDLRLIARAATVGPLLSLVAVPVRKSQWT